MEAIVISYILIGLWVGHEEYKWTRYWFPFDGLEFMSIWFMSLFCGLFWGITLIGTESREDLFELLGDNDGR